MLSFSISNWDPWSILWVSFFQSHIQMHGHIKAMYIHFLVLFCFFQGNRVIRQVALSLGLLYPLFQWYMGADLLSGSLQNSIYTHTHLYICCIPKPAMILRITLFPQENRLDLTPMLWEKWVKKPVVADSIISYLPPLLTSYLPTYDPLCQRTCPLGHILPPSLSLGLSLLALSEWLTRIQIAYQGCLFTA
jgi:hypothetical protein